MAWITLSESSLESRLLAGEITAYKSSDLSVGQTSESLLSEILRGVIREVRGRVAACESNTLGEGDTIPDELEHHALAVAVYRLITRIPISSRSSLLEQRKSAYEDALRILQDVASCRFAIVDPITPSEEVVSAQRPLYTTKTSNWNRDSQDGL
jgi:hypothetical protein